MRKPIVLAYGYISDPHPAPREPSSEVPPRAMELLRMVLERCEKL